MSRFRIMCVLLFHSLVLSFTDYMVWAWGVDQHVHIHPFHVHICVGIDMYACGGYGGRP